MYSIQSRFELDMNHIWLIFFDYLQKNIRIIGVQG